MKALIIAAVLATASACSLQTVGSPKGHLTLTATFDDVQTLVSGHSVQISDVRVGTVTGIRLDGYRSKVTMSIKDGRRIPVGTSATVARTSLLGENYVRLDLPPAGQAPAGAYLTSGAALTQTSVQPDIEQVGEKAGPLIAALAGQDTGAVIKAAATAFTGRGPQLNRLISQITDISDSYAASRQDLGRTLDGLAGLGRSLAKGGAELDRLPDSLDTATQRLRADRSRLKDALNQLTRLAHSFNNRVQTRHAQRLRTMLTRLDAALSAMVRGRQELKTVLSEAVKIFRLPSITQDGRALGYAWFKGLLPPRGAPRTGTDAGGGATPFHGPEGGLRRLLEPPR